MADLLPDSRARDGREVTRHWFLGNTVPIFCANCGKEGGRVPEENCTFAFWLCDNCVETFGPIAGTMMVPDEVFWQQVADDMKGEADEDQKRHGHPPLGSA